MPTIVSDVLYEYAQGIKKIYGIHLRKIILYGSYARGDYHESSDVDVLILVDLDDIRIKQKMSELAEYTFEMELKCDLQLSPIVKNEEQFEYWSDTLPFYKNILREGVSIGDR